MLTDEKIRIAAEEADQAMMEQLEAFGNQTHSFSKKFHRRMHSLLIKRKHPLLKKVMQMAAGFALVIVLSGSFLLLFSSNSRAAFLEWLVSLQKTYVEYFPSGEVKDSEQNTQYRLGIIPEGYELYDFEATEQGGYAVYCNEQGYFLKFHYLYGTGDAHFFIEIGDYQCKETQIGDIPAEFYDASDNDVGNTLIWRSEGNLFCIDGYFNEEELISLAENVGSY